MSNETFAKKGPKTIITNDYDRFVPFEFNRDVRKTKQLRESMEKYGFDEGSAINCREKLDGRLQIIQGHHRFAVAKGLGIPVAVIISKSEVPVWSLECGTHPWNLKDYFTGFAREGRKEYQQVLNFSGDTGISCGVALTAMQGGVTTGGEIYTRRAKRGDIELPHKENAERIGHIVKSMTANGHKFATANLFVSALMKCFLLEEWSDEKWLQKVRKHGALLERQPDERRYLEMIELVYNRKVKDEEKIPLAFKARQKAKEKKDRAFNNNETNRR